MKSKWILKGLKFAAFAALAVAGLGLLVVGLWNVLVPDLFGGPYITFWQAIGLLALVRLLLVGVRPWGWRGPGYRGKPWQQRWEAKMASLTPEEREKIKQAYAQRCGSRFRNREKGDPQPESVAKN